MLVLDVAPTPSLQSMLIGEGATIASIDLVGVNGVRRMDIEQLEFGDATFDAILCIHVLEHVNNDHRALRELFRVLKPSGWAILMVPIYESRALTDEDPSITDPAERERRFGQIDHVRLYGADYVSRCESAGFRMEIVAPKDHQLVRRQGFLSGEKLYIGWKR